MMHRMSASVFIAGSLAVLLGVAHSYVGERDVVRRILECPDLPPLWGGAVLMRRTVRFAWHLTSVAWLGAGALLMLFAARLVDASARLTVLVLGGIFLASAVVAFVGSRGRHPAWVICLTIAAAAWYGTR
jgi:hypothetical protein